MSNFEAPLLNASVIATFRTAGILYVSTTAATSRRYQVYEVEFGQTGSLASTDIQATWDLSRAGATNALVGSSVTPNALDPGDAAPIVGLYFNNITTEPTYTTAGNGLSLKQWAINQRGSYRWRALDDGDNLIIPATLQHGIGVRMLIPAGVAAMSAFGNISFVER